MADTNPNSSEGYRAALQLIAHEGKIVWDSFRTLLTLNTGIIAISSAALNAKSESAWSHPAFIIVLSFAGILGCVAWLCITLRSFAYYGYWFTWARIYERQALGEDQMIQLGKRFSDGLDLPARPDIKPMTGLARIKIRYIVSSVILVFIMAHILILGILFWRSIERQPNSALEQNGTAPISFHASFNFDSQDSKPTTNSSVGCSTAVRH